MSAGKRTGVRSAAQNADEDKYLHLYFNLRYYSVNEIEKTLNIWEDRIKDITKSADMKRVGEGWRNNSLIHLIL